MFTKNRLGFTLLESVITLFVISLIIVALQTCMPMFSNHVKVSNDITFHTILHQIESQNYKLLNTSQNNLSLESKDGKIMTLLVEKEKLKIKSEQAGQIILMEHVRHLNIEDKKYCLRLVLQDSGGETLEGLLFLKQKVSK